MHSRRNISGTLLAILLVLSHFFGMIGFGMSVPVGSTEAVKFGSRISLISLLYGFIQTFYILLRPTFSAPCSYRVRLLKTAGFAVSSVMATGNLIVGMTVCRDTCHEDVVQASAAALALFHGGLFWAYTRIPVVFLPFVVRPSAPPLHIVLPKQPGLGLV